MSDQNRTLTDSGVRLNGNLLDVTPITGTGMSPAQAIAAAQPIVDFLACLPYTLDEFGEIAYRGNSTTLTHTPELTYAVGHPLAGQLINADFSGGDYAIKFGGGPMPFIDMDTIPPFALKKWLQALHDFRDAILNAT